VGNPRVKPVPFPTNKPLEGKLLDEELRELLVTPDLTESDGTRMESVRLLDSSSGSLEERLFQPQ